LHRLTARSAAPLPCRRCWNALSWRDDAGELRRGIELAKKVQCALVSDGGGVVVQRLYHNFRAFRIFDLSEHKLSNHALLCHPMALQRLAAFFQEQHLHQSHANRRKPVVLVGPRDAVSGRCLVVGYQVAAPGQGNKLGAAFEAAAEEVGAQAWHDLFDTTIMEVAAEDVERFKAELLRVATELL
jgi:cell division control protein 45